jgi:hypothetical protein
LRNPAVKAFMTDLKAVAQDRAANPPAGLKPAPGA